MDILPFKYIRNANFIKFDHTLCKNKLFFDELESKNTYKVLKSCRFIINKDYFTNLAYNSTLKMDETEYGYIISYNDNYIMLISVGENIFYLADSNFDKSTTQKLLYTFMVNTNSYIDVSKYKFMFKNAFKCHYFKHIKNTNKIESGNMLSVEEIKDNYLVTDSSNIVNKYLTR